jgi:hypothetical protein
LIFINATNSAIGTLVNGVKISSLEAASYLRTKEVSQGKTHQVFTMRTLEVTSTDTVQLKPDVISGF